MKHLVIIGIGAVGSIFGALFSEELDTKLIAKKTSVEVLNQNGITITGNINKHVEVVVTSNIEEISPETLILLTVKAYDLEAVAKTLAKKALSDTRIVC